MHSTPSSDDGVSPSAADTNDGAHYLKIPAELRDQAQWVSWRWAKRDGKPTKVPVNPRTGGNADPTDPGTWGTFEQAVTRATTDRLDGAGFVFTEDDPYGGADLDDCRDPETGEIHPEALTEVARLGSYTEVSPSKTGLKVFLKGKKPGARCKNKDAPWGGAIELYDKDKFFTVTGEHLTGTPLNVRDRHEAYERAYERFFGPGGEDTEGGYEVWNTGLTDEQVIVKAAFAKHGEKFRRLFYDGDTSGYGGDDSTADMALVGMVAFWTGPDPEQIERIVRRSALARAKWDEVRAYPYLRRTIDRVLKGRNEYYTGPDSIRSNIVSPPEKKEMKFRPVSEVLEEAGEETDWVAEGVGARGAFTDFVGRAKFAGKTTFLANMAANVSRGKPFLGKPTKRVPVLLLTEQGSNIRKPLQDAGLDRENENVYVMQWKDTQGASWPEIVEATKAEALRVGAGIVIVDTVNRFAGLQGDDENSAGHVMAALRPLVALAQEMNIAVIGVRHANKLGEGRGSTAFEHEVDILLTLKRPLGGYDSNVRELDGKGRYDGIPEELMIELTDKGYRVMGTGGDVALKAAMDQLMEIVPTSEKDAKRRDILLDELNEEFGVSRSTGGRALSTLHKKGSLVCLGKGKRGDPYRYYSPFTPEEHEEMRDSARGPHSFRSNRGGEGVRGLERNTPDGENPIGKGNTPHPVSFQRDPFREPSSAIEKEGNRDEFATPPDNPVPSGAYDIKPALERLYARLRRPVTAEEVAAEAGLPVDEVRGYLLRGEANGAFSAPWKGVYQPNETPSRDLDIGTED